MIDDLCDSGLTLLSVRDRLLEAGAASVKSVVLLDKRARRKVCSAGLSVAGVCRQGGGSNGRCTVCVTDVDRAMLVAGWLVMTWWVTTWESVKRLGHILLSLTV